MTSGATCATKSFSLVVREPVPDNICSGLFLELRGQIAYDVILMLHEVDGAVNGLLLALQDLLAEPLEKQEFLSL